VTYREQPIVVKLIAAADSDTLPDDVNVLYLTPGNAAFAAHILDVAVARKILVCSGVPEYVVAQYAALGFGEFEGKPQILLNLAVAKRLEHEFDNPKFLNLQTTGKLVLIK